MQLSYNGLSFEHIHCVKFDQEAVFERSDTDYKYTKVSVIISAVMAIQPDDNNNLVGLLPSNVTNDQDVQATIRRVTSLLETPRQVLLIEDDTHVILYTYGAGTKQPTSFLNENPPQLDCALGPKARVFNITRFDGGKVLHITFQVETWILECTSMNKPIILTHRWTEQQSFDKIFRTTYRRSGFIATATQGDSNTGNSTADTIGRPISFAPLRNGFRRQDGEYILSEDGLGLSYSFTDVQLFRTFPAPALDGTGTYTENTGRGASIRNAACHVRLQGAPDGSQSALLRTAVIVCMNQFGPLIPNPAQPPPAQPKGNAINVALVAVGLGGLAAISTNKPPVPVRPTAIILRASLAYDLYENSVAVDVEAQLPLANQNNLGLPFPILTFVAIPPGSKQYTDSGAEMPIPVMFGQNQGQYNSQTASQIKLLAAALGVPCTAPGSNPGGSGGGKGFLGLSSAIPAISSALNAQGAKAGIASGANAQDLNAASSETEDNVYNANAGMYTEYELQAFYRDVQCKLQLPNATPAGGPKTASIVQWANPVDDVVVEFSARRVGDWPSIPSLGPQDENLVYMDSQLIPGPPVPMGDGFSMEYSVQGKIYYAVIDPGKLVFNTGLYPWLSKGVAPAAVMPTTVFDPTIMNPGSGGGTPGGTPNIEIPQA